MILVAYACLAVAVGVFLRRRSAIRRSRRTELLTRLLGTVGSGAAALLALLLLSRSHHSQLGLTALLLLLCGSIVYLAGLALWHWRWGFLVRLVGWSLATAALAIPSTLTLFLPIAAVLALTVTDPQVTAVSSRPAKTTRSVARST